MAEIKIEKKSPIWPWILLGLVLAALIYFLAFAGDDDVDDVDDLVVEDEMVEDDIMAASTAASKNEIAAYASYVGGNPDVGANYMYSKNALLKLIAAVKAKAAATGADIDAELGEAKQKAMALSGAVEDTEQAELVKEAADIINQALETIQEGAYSNLDSLMDKVENTASEIEESDVMMEQQKDFNQYFLAAEALLLNMNDGLNQATIDSDATLTRFSNYISDTGKMGIDHVYSNNALDYLIEATKAKANLLNVDINADLEQAMANAHEITEDPYEVNHADLIKNSGQIIVKALGTIQSAKFPDLKNDVDQISQAVAKISKGTHTLDQKNDVNNFFKAASELLTKMK